jgi:hypothetical protein
MLSWITIIVVRVWSTSRLITQPATVTSTHYSVVQLIAKCPAHTYISYWFISCHPVMLQITSYHVILEAFKCEKLMNSMQQSPSWETKSCSARHKISSILRNLKLNYCVQVGLYPQPDESTTHLPHYISFRSFLILSFHLCLDIPSGLLCSGFLTKTLRISPLYHAWYMLCHAPWFDHLNNIWWRAQIIKVLIM